MGNKKIYIYGIVPNHYSTEMFRLLENTDLFAIRFQNISAIVAYTDLECVDYSDRESLGYLLVEHQQIIEDLMEKGFFMIVPVKLGTIIRSAEEVIKILAHAHDLIINTLKKIEYLTEIDLTITWANFPVILNEVAIHPEVSALKGEILAKSAELSQVDQVKIGMLIQEKLKENNMEVELKILDALSSLTEDVIIHDTMNDQMVTNSAFLLNRKKRELFEQKINALDEEYGGSMNFKIIGPLPCYSFYTLEIKELNSKDIAEAIKDLELTDVMSESNIKKAYLRKAKLLHPDSQMVNGNEESFTKINRAYHTMLDYSSANPQSSGVDCFVQTKEEGLENLFLVKIKD